MTVQYAIFSAVISSLLFMSYRIRLSALLKRQFWWVAYFQVMTGCLWFSLIFIIIKAYQESPGLEVTCKLIAG